MTASKTLLIVYHPMTGGTRKFGGFTAGATYSFGRDAVNAGPSPSGTNCAGENPADSRACREWSAMLMYESGKWGVSAAYDSQRGGRGGPGAFGGLTSSALKDDRLARGGYALFDRAKVGLGWIGRRNAASTTPRSDLFYAGVAYDLTPALTLSGEVFHLRFHSSANKAWLGAARASYALSKRSSVYATVGYIENRGSLALSVDSAATGAAPTTGRNQLGTMVGIKHVF